MQNREAWRTLAGIMTEQELTERHIIISEDVEGDLTIPLGAQAIVLFAHGSGSSRYSSRNQFVAAVLNKKRIATLLVDLLNQEEKRIDEETKHLRYNIGLLARRFTAVTNWIAQQPETRDLAIGYFGSSTGAAAALITAERLGLVKTIVTRGGRPDLAGERALRQVKAPILFIVGGNDMPVISMNKRAFELLSSAEAKELAIIPGATHLFEETGNMEEVAQIAADWFECHLLGTSKRFYNRYARVSGSGFFSSLRSKYAFHIKFRDRFAAGKILASVLSRYKNEQDGVTVIGIARGGVIVADPIAEKLDADFDIIVPRKLRSPHNSENAIGSIMHDDSVHLDLDASTLVAQHDVSNEYIEMEKFEQKKEIERRLTMYRPYTREYRIKHRTVILVDDGIATGSTMIAAARWIRKQKPRRLIIAAPVAPKKAIEHLKNEADQIEVVKIPSEFNGVELFYQDFASVPDDQIVKIALRRFRP
jgi:predicted phosphoribosyltransferase/dienelactone hydrolase